MTKNNNTTRMQVRSIVGRIDGEKSIANGKYRQYWREMSKSDAINMVSHICEIFADDDRFVKAYYTESEGRWFRRYYVRIVMNHDKNCRCKHCTM